jgi:hypothetical protein
VHANVSGTPAVAPAADRSQWSGPAVAAGVVSEDVVDLVAAAACAEAADIGPVAIAILELDLGLVVRLDLLLVIRVIFGEPEVDERAMPGVPEGHIRVRVRERESFPCS